MALPHTRFVSLGQILLSLHEDVHWWPGFFIHFVVHIFHVYHVWQIRVSTVKIEDVQNTLECLFARCVEIAPGGPGGPWGSGSPLTQATPLGPGSPFAPGGPEGPWGWGHFPLISHGHKAFTEGPEGGERSYWDPRHLQIAHLMFVVSRSIRLFCCVSQPCTGEMWTVI